MEKEGLGLVRDREKYSHGKKTWQIEIVDTTLAPIWSTELELDNRLSLVGFEHGPGQLYLLFREEQTNYYNFQLLTMHFYEKSFQLNKIQFDLTFRLTHFTVTGSSAIFGGYVNSEPAVLLYNQSSEHPKVLPGLFTRGITLLDVRANQNQSFNVLLVEKRGIEKDRLIVRTFDHEGNLLIDDVIDVDSKFSILSGLTSSLIRDEMMIIGTYGEGNSKLAMGFYSVVVDPFNEQSVLFTEFSSLEHFLDYLPEKKAMKIKLKAQKQKSEGHIPNYKASVLPFRLEERNTGFYLLSEVYNSSSNINSYPYSNPSTSYNNGPDGYGYPYRSNPYFNAPYMNNPPVRNTEVRMIETVVIKFGALGPEKDVSIKLEDIKQSALDQKGDFLIVNDSLVLGYKKKSEIWFQRESAESGTLTSVRQSKVNLMRPTDILKDENEDVGGLRYWYENHFYVWGYQQIKTRLNNEVHSRYVFYVNRADL